MVARALILAGLLSGCGAATPTLMAHGMFADSIGFACECGAKAFWVVSRGPIRMWLRCADCHREWAVYR